MGLKTCPRADREGCTGVLITIPTLTLQCEQSGIDPESHELYPTLLKLFRTAVAKCTACSFEEVVFFDTYKMTLEEFLSIPTIPELLTHSEGEAPHECYAPTVPDA